MTKNRPFFRELKNWWFLVVMQSGIHKTIRPGSPPWYQNLFWATDIRVPMCITKSRLEFRIRPSSLSYSEEYWSPQMSGICERGKPDLGEMTKGGLARDFSKMNPKTHMLLSFWITGYGHTLSSLEGLCPEMPAFSQDGHFNRHHVLDIIQNTLFLWTHHMLLGLTSS